MIPEKIFREYDIRGLADSDLNSANIDTLSKAIGTFLRRNQVKSVALGYDCRTSSPRISGELSQGLRSCGLNVVDVGLVPTPLLYFAVIQLRAGGGVMITGSHNPPDHNGFKIVCGPGTIHGEEIQEIREICRLGKFESGKGGLEKREIKEDYFKAVLKSVPGPFRLKVVADSGNGMAGLVAPELFRRLGCEVIELFSEPDGRFPNHHPDPTQAENLRDLTAAMAKHRAHLGVAFDGDADRIGAVDPSGRPLYGDELLVLYARQILESHPGARIISEVKASHRLFQDIEKHGGVPILWKTGHSLIKAKMREEKALLAGEMSGHMFFNDRFYGFDDAIYAAARLIEIVSKTGRSPMDLLADLPKSFTTPEIRVDCPDEIKFKVVDLARKSLQGRGLAVLSIDGARVDFGDGWGLVRASNTQPVLVYRFEAQSQVRLTEIQSVIEKAVETARREVR